LTGLQSGFRQSPIVHAADLIHEHRDINLTALFGPQHGIRGDVQDNDRDGALKGLFDATSVILYSETREPTEQMLSDVDVWCLTCRV
jgi:uncharacterized protein YbbC (DUF1343 family)